MPLIQSDSLPGDDKIEGPILNRYCCQTNRARELCNCKIFSHSTRWFIGFTQTIKFHQRISYEHESSFFGFFCAMVTCVDCTAIVLYCAMILNAKVSQSSDSTTI